MPYLPTGAFGHALITSRHHTWRAVAQTVPVRVLPRAAAVRFVLERTGQQDERSARRICEVLGDLPLALEQAGAYIDATRRPLAEYLEIFAAHQQELLRREPAPSDYPGTVITTWEMALRQVSEISSASADLLNLCAFLAPDQIDRTLLAHGTEHLPRQLADALSAPLRFDEAVEPVLRYSLMEAKNGHLSMHRLVQAVTRDRLPRMDGAARRRPSWRWLRRGQHVDPQERWAEVAVRIVDGEFPEPNARSWSTCASLMPHALATVAHAEALHVAVSVTNHLLTQVGVYLGERAQFSEAQSVLERAVRTCEQSLGPDHPDTIASLTSLGFLIRTQGDLAGARPYFERAVTASDRALGQHPQTATCLEFLGSLMRAQGDLTGARPHIERALAIRTAVVGSEHQDTAVSLASLGTLLQALGEFDAARPYLEEALAISEKTVGLDDPLVATNVTNLGLLLQTQGDLQVALPLLERALAIREASFGSDYRDTWTSLSNLGGLLVALGDLDSARPHLERALSSYERALGPSHPHVASCLIHLGSLQQAEGDLATARANLERAVQIRERALGLEHPHTAASWFALGNLLRAAGDEHGARRYFERALAVREEKLGPDHPDTITSRASLENEYEPRPA